MPSWKTSVAFVGYGPIAAEVAHVCAERAEADQLPLVEDRLDQRCVRRLAGGQIGVVVDEDVSGSEVVPAAELLDRARDAVVERPDEDRQARRLGDQVQPVVVQRHAEVVVLVEDREHRRSLEDPVDLPGRRDQRVPDDRERDRVELGDCSPASPPPRT